MLGQKKKLLVVDIAALGWNLVEHHTRAIGGLEFRRANSVFPAVTCVAQASFRTASQPGDHGLVSNGIYFKSMKKPLFWEQASSLVQGPRIWDEFRSRGKTVGMLFWQQSLGEDVDVILSPRPIHKHSGGMIQHVYAKPGKLYDELCDAIGRPFNLMHYWGPLASHKSSDWIVAATKHVMSMDDAPDLLFSYLPHLDYDMQSRGPNSRKASVARDVLFGYLSQLAAHADDEGYDVLFFGDYAIDRVTAEAAFPNRALRESGLFKVMKVRNMAYPDFFDSDAFAVVDHEVAHVFAKPEALAKTRSTLAACPGVGEILDRDDQRALGLDHPRSGDFVIVADEGSWFAYPWWTERYEAPDFATHVDIHNKPGYDPCELFFGWPPLAVSQNTSRVRGTHGRAGRDIAWATTCAFSSEPSTMVELAQAVKVWIDKK